MKRVAIGVWCVSISALCIISADAQEPFSHQQDATRIVALTTLLEARPAEGISLSLFRQFQNMPGASDLAIGYLREETKLPSWSNAVIALGAIGDIKAFDAIKSFISAPTDPGTGSNRLRPSVFDAKVNCIFAFGYMAAFSPEAEVRSKARLWLDLANGINSQELNALEWESPYHKDKQHRNAYLVSKIRLANQNLAQHAASGTLIKTGGLYQ